jgi:hypothetical protein
MLQALLQERTVFGWVDRGSTTEHRYSILVVLFPPWKEIRWPDVILLLF